MTASTEERSLSHWSEARRDEMDSFYAVATQDYRFIAQRFDWKSRLAGVTDVLDVACGSGKFPAALVRHAGLPVEPAIDLHLLDPSAFSIEETARSLRAPFRPGSEYCVTVQDLAAEAGPFPAVWAVHGLYAVPRAELRAALRRFVAAVAPGGFGFIAQAYRDAHYIAFYEGYLEGRDGEPYCAADDVLAELKALDVEVEVVDIAYEGRIDDRAVLEGYLQRCLFDDDITLAEMEADPVLGAYLGRHRQGEVYVFPQRVALIQFAGKS
ncbi:MAG: class I SAM-dependent methyltransferase [Myxococcota bacterium]